MIGIYLHEFTNNELQIFNKYSIQYWNFLSVVSELVQVHSDNSLAEWVNL